MFQAMGHTPFNPVKGTYWPMGYPVMFKVLFVKKQLNGDYLLCDDGRGELFKVGLPLNMQKTFFVRDDEPQFADGKYYVWENILITKNEDQEATSWQQKRKVYNENPDSGDSTTTAENATDQRIIPAYVLGEPILAIKIADDKDPHNVQWMDLNTAGRTWQEEIKLSVKEVIVEHVNFFSGTIRCYDPSASEYEKEHFENYLTVAMPYELRAVSYDGKTRHGVSYSTAGGDSSGRTIRKASYISEEEALEEYQAVVPPYYIGEPIVVSEYIDADNEHVTHIDLNLAGRSWAAYPEDIDDIEGVD